MHHPHQRHAGGSQRFQAVEVGEFVHVGQVRLKTLQRGVDRTGTVPWSQWKTMGESFLPGRFSAARTRPVENAHDMPAALQFPGSCEHIRFGSGQGPKTFMHKKHSHIRGHSFGHLSCLLNPSAIHLPSVLSPEPEPSQIQPSPSCHNARAL